jgi:hypothetical protein
MRYRIAIRVHGPIDACFSYSIDPRNSLEAHPKGTTIIKVTDGPIGLGTVFRYDRPGKEGWMTSKIVEFDPPNSFTTEAKNGQWGRMTFVEKSGITRIETEADFDPLPRPLKWLTPVAYAVLLPCLWPITRKAERIVNRGVQGAASAE